MRSSCINPIAVGHPQANGRSTTARSQLSLVLTWRDHMAVCEDDAPMLVHHEASGVGGPSCLCVKAPGLSLKKGRDEGGKNQF